MHACTHRQQQQEKQQSYSRGATLHIERERRMPTYVREGGCGDLCLSLSIHCDVCGERRRGAHHYHPARAPTPTFPSLPPPKASNTPNPIYSIPYPSSSPPLFLPFTTIEDKMLSSSSYHPPTTLATTTVISSLLPPKARRGRPVSSRPQSACCSAFLRFHAKLSLVVVVVGG